MLKLEIPNETHREMYETMVEEWKNYEEIPTSPSILFKRDSYDEFLNYIQKLGKGQIEDRTASSLYFGIESGKIIGAIDIRHNIKNPKLKKYSGHIGYGVRPSERNKGYATKLLELGIDKAKDLGIEKILIACHPENIASEKVILKNGGEYFETLEKENKKYKKFWITL